MKRNIVIFILVASLSVFLIACNTVSEDPVQTDPNPTESMGQEGTGTTQEPTDEDITFTQPTEIPVVTPEDEFDNTQPTQPPATDPNATEQPTQTPAEPVQTDPPVTEEPTEPKSEFETNPDGSIRLPDIPL